jgi:hypothetical protein
MLGMKRPKGRAGTTAQGGAEPGTTTGAFRELGPRAVLDPPMAWVAERVQSLWEGLPPSRMLAR